MVKMTPLLLVFLLQLFFTLEGVIAVPPEQMPRQTLNNTHASIHKKVCNTLMIILEKNFNLKLYPGMLIEFETQNRHPMVTTPVKSACNAVIAISLSR